MAAPQPVTPLDVAVVTGGALLGRWFVRDPIPMERSHPERRMVASGDTSVRSTSTRNPRDGRRLDTTHSRPRLRREGP